MNINTKILLFLLINFYSLGFSCEEKIDFEPTSTPPQHIWYSLAPIEIKFLTKQFVAMCYRITPGEGFSDLHKKKLESINFNAQLLDFMYMALIGKEDQKKYKIILMNHLSIAFNNFLGKRKFSKPFPSEDSSSLQDKVLHMLNLIDKFSTEMLPWDLEKKINKLISVSRRNFTEYVSALTTDDNSRKPLLTKYKEAGLADGFNSSIRILFKDRLYSQESQEKKKAVIYSFAEIFKEYLKKTKAFEIADLTYEYNIIHLMNEFYKDRMLPLVQTSRAFEFVQTDECDELMNKLEAELTQPYKVFRGDSCSCFSSASLNLQPNENVTPTKEASPAQETDECDELMNELEAELTQPYKVFRGESCSCFSSTSLNLQPNENVISIKEPSPAQETDVKTTYQDLLGKIDIFDNFELF